MSEENISADSMKSKPVETPEIYFFIGSDATLEGPGYSHTLSHFGQTVELLPSQAIIHAAHGARLVPESLFHEIGFSKQELELYGNARLHSQDHPDQEFIGKRNQALASADTFQRESLEVLDSKGKV